MATIIKEPTILVKCSKPEKKEFDSIRCMAVESNTRYFPINMMWIYQNKLNRTDDEFMPIDALKSTLAEMLNEFPILSGRITEDENANATIHLTNEGVAFTAARCPDQRLDFFLLRTNEDNEGEFDYANINASDLRVPVANSFAGPMVSIQVTRLQCGSVIITVSAFHCLMDGQGAADFINAWAQAGQSLKKPPYFDKSFVLLTPEELPAQPITRPSDCVFTRSADPLPLTPFVSNQQQRVISRVYHFSEDELNTIKAAAMKDLPSTVEYISTYDAVYAHLILVIASATQSSFEQEPRMKVLQSLNGRPIFAAAMKSPAILNYFGSFPFWLYGQMPQDPTPPTLSSLAAFIHNMYSKQTVQSLKYYNAYLSSDDGNIGKNRVDADLINWDFHCASWRKSNMLGASFFEADNYPVYSGPSTHLFPRYFAMMDSPKRDQSVNIVLGFREDDYQRMLDQKFMHKYRSISE